MMIIDSLVQVWVELGEGQGGEEENKRLWTKESKQSKQLKGFLKKLGIIINKKGT